MRCLFLISLIVALPATSLCTAGESKATQPSKQTPAIPLFGRVSWPQKDLSNSYVRIFEDPECKRPVKVQRTSGRRASFATSLEPGTYYFMGFADRDGNGKPGAGDGIGFFGVTTSDGEPAGFRIGHHTKHATVNIPISLQFAEDGRSLQAIPVKPPELQCGPKTIEISGSTSGLSNSSAGAFVLFAPTEPHLVPFAAPIDDNGEFAISIASGTYHVLAVADTDGSGAIDTSDAVGVAGYKRSMQGELPALEITADASPLQVPIQFQWVLGKRNRLRTPDGMAVGPILNPATLPAIVAGTITHDGSPVTGATVRSFADAQCRKQRYRTWTDDNGRYYLAMRPAVYYLSCEARAGTGQDARKGVYHGPDNPATEPAPIPLKPAGIYSDVDISVDGSVTSAEGEE